MMNKPMVLTRIMFKFGLTSSLLPLMLSTLVVAQDYVPPPTGPYQSSVVIDRMDRSTPEQNRIYRFPPADLVEPPPPLLDDAEPPAELQTTEQNSRPMDAAQATRGSGSDPAQDYRQAYPRSQAYPPAAQWGYAPYQYGSGWNTNNQPYAYPPAYPQQAYPYGYNQYDNRNEFFPGMPTPWTDNPMQQFFGQ